MRGAAAETGKSVSLKLLALKCAFVVIYLTFGTIDTYAQDCPERLIPSDIFKWQNYKIKMRNVPVRNFRSDYRTTVMEFALRMSTSSGFGLDSNCVSHIVILILRHEAPLTDNRGGALIVLGPPNYYSDMQFRAGTIDIIRRSMIDEFKKLVAE